MPRDGRNAAAGLAIAERVLRKDEGAGTIVFMSDGFDESRTSEFLRIAKASKHQLLWLAVGTPNGVPDTWRELRACDGRCGSSVDRRF